MAQSNCSRKNTRKTPFQALHYDEKLLTILMDLECISLYFIIQVIEDNVTQSQGSSF